MCTVSRSRASWLGICAKSLREDQRQQPDAKYAGAKVIDFDIYRGGGSSTPKIMKLDFLFLLSFSATFMCKCPSFSFPSLG